jgi:hypothetical protein
MSTFDRFAICGLPHASRNNFALNRRACLSISYDENKLKKE